MPLMDGIPVSIRKQPVQVTNEGIPLQQQIRKFVAFPTHPTAGICRIEVPNGVNWVIASLFSFWFTTATPGDRLIIMGMGTQHVTTNFQATLDVVPTNGHVLYITGIRGDGGGAPWTINTLNNAITVPIPDMIFRPGDGITITDTLNVDDLDTVGGGLWVWEYPIT
jgi:hypothetical protein